MRRIRIISGSAVGLFIFSISAAAPAPASPSLQLVRWDLVVNDAGWSLIQQAGGQTVYGSRAGYQAAYYDADMLRAAIVKAESSQGVAGVSSALAMSHPTGGGIDMSPLCINYGLDENSRAALQGMPQGNETLANAGDDSVELKLNYPAIDLRLLEKTDQGGLQTQQEPHQYLKFDGTLSTGQAVAFSTGFAGKSGQIYHHVIAWELFKQDQRKMDPYGYLINDCDWWIRIGPKGMNQIVDAAVAWNATAKRYADEVSPKWEKKLDDGKILRLSGMCRIDKWPFCWWDGDGQAVSIPQSIVMFRTIVQHPFWCAIGIGATKDQLAHEMPPVHSAAKLGLDEMLRGQMLHPLEADDFHHVTVGVAVGPWQYVADTTSHGSFVFNGQTYTLNEFGMVGDPSFMVNFNFATYQPMPAEEITLTAVAKDGTEVAPSYLDQVYGKRSVTSMPQFRDISVDNVKAFHIWKRKIQWVTFSDLPAEPVKTPSPTSAD